MYEIIVFGECFNSSLLQIIYYSPSSGMVVPQTHLTNKLLMRRYALVQQARDADVFGILVGTLGVCEFTPVEYAIIIISDLIHTIKHPISPLSRAFATNLKKRTKSRTRYRWGKSILRS